MGTEGMAKGTYPCTIQALEDSQVCELRLDRLPETGKTLELVQQRIIRLLGHEVAFNHALISTLVHNRAEQRVSGFLLNLSDRLKQRDMPYHVFSLEMTQSDIGSFLGLTNATVSRVLARLQKSGLISLRHREVRILDSDSLRTTAQS
jgi:CRP/FNR family transcriptional regulator